VLVPSFVIVTPRYLNRTQSRMVFFIAITFLRYCHSKVFPWLQTFITRKLPGIQRCFFTIT
jgi:hypothetical protein